MDYSVVLFVVLSMNGIWPKPKSDPVTGARHTPVVQLERVRKMQDRAICSLQGRCFHVTSELTSVCVVTELVAATFE